jgi:hypothetical protein
MLATFLIAFHTRRIDNLTQTVRFLSKNHPDVVAESEVIFLCQDQCGFVDNDFAKSRMVNLRFSCMEKCKALNQGVRESVSDRIVILDSDRILPPGYFSDVLRCLKPGTAVTTKLIHRVMHSSADVDIESGDYNFQLEHRSVSNDPYNRNLFAGNVAIHKSDYWNAGGMDEEYVGYGFEDSDMAMRVVQSGIKPVFRSDAELHLFHEPATYGPTDQKKLFLNNGIRYCKNWNIPIPPPLQAEINAYTRRFI